MEKADTEKHTRMLLAEPRDDSELDDDSRNRFKKKKEVAGFTIYFRSGNDIFVDCRIGYMG